MAKARGFTALSGPPLPLSVRGGFFVILLVSGATKTVYSYAGNQFIGVLVEPSGGNDITKIPEGMQLAADNGCFNGLDAVKFIKMLERLKKSNVLWVTCPDAVADADVTRERFKIWSPLVKSYELPLAYVIQDGELIHKIPWDDISCIFIGGSTEWKLRGEVREMVQYAKRLGKWVHMGRVNGKRRMQYALEVGCDSVDGSSFSKFPDAHIPWALKMLSEFDQLPRGDAQSAL